MKYNYLIKSEKEFWELLKADSIKSNPSHPKFELKPFLDNIKEVLDFNNTESQIGDFVEDKNTIEEIFQIANIINRYRIIKSLIRLNNNAEIDFGIFGLLLYLGLTCFDSLGQKEKYKTFHEWIISKKNTHIKSLEDEIRINKKSKLKDELDSLFIKQYVPEFGMKNSFYSFLNLLETKYNSSYINLMNCIEIPPRYKKDLKRFNQEENFKKDSLFSFRNDFTHNSRNLRWPLDNDLLNMNFRIESYSLQIGVRPINLVNAVLSCIKDGIEMKLDDLGILCNN